MTEGLCPRSRGSALCYKVIGVTFLTGRGLFYFTSHIKIPADLFFIMHICDRLCVFKAARYTTRLQFRCSMTFIFRKTRLFLWKIYLFTY